MPPRAPSTGGAQVAAIPAGVPRAPREVILIIDDEAGIREVLRDMVQLRGYRAILADDGPAGLALFRDHQAEICAVITDVRLPTMHGGTVIAALRSADPALPIVVVTGWLGGSAGPLTKVHNCITLAKPIIAAELFAAMAQVLGKTGDQAAAVPAG